LADEGNKMLQYLAIDDIEACHISLWDVPSSSFVLGFRHSSVDYWLDEGFDFADNFADDFLLDFPAGF
jgi:hypothetical protein